MAQKYIDAYKSLLDTGGVLQKPRFDSGNKTVLWLCQTQHDIGFSARKNASRQVETLNEPIAGQARPVDERDKTIAAQKRQIAILHDKVKDIYASRSWRLTRPLRGIKRALGKLAGIIFRGGG